MHEMSGMRQAEENMSIDAESAPARIGVIADTHNVLPESVGECFQGVDEIWHLGDVCEPRVLDELRGICSRLVAVRGNNDWNLSLAISRELRRGAELFYLVHILPNRPMERYDWVLYGHTHVPRLDLQGNPKYLNPGAVGRCNRGAPPSVAVLELGEGGRYEAKIMLLP